MKLNNKGWGLTEMIIICCGVLLCLLIIIYYVNVFTGSFKEKPETTPAVINPPKEPDNTNKEPEVEEEDTDQYTDYIILLQEKAINYVLTLNIMEEETTLYIPVEDLINNNYVDKLEDCDGHVDVNKSNDIYTANAYLTCSNFSNEE